MVSGDRDNTRAMYTKHNKQHGKVRCAGRQPYPTPQLADIAKHKARH